MATRVVLPLLAVFLILGFLARGVLRPPEGERVRASLSVEEFMAGDSQEGFQRALEPRPFRFPEDHGPHPGFRTEWWYLTGNLMGPQGEPYGFQFTIFRSALSPEVGGKAEASGGGGTLAQGNEGLEKVPGKWEDTPSTEVRSLWRTNQLYMGHFAVTDGPGRRHLAFESFSRGALGLAGAQAVPFRVWLGDWEIVGPDSGVKPSDGMGIFPLTLRGSQDQAALTLVLDPQKPMVLQGDMGLSQKGPEPGNASYYYSFTRLAASGVLVLSGDSIPVTGSAWMDREWSTSALSQGQVGWDWFALQLDDAHDLMYYQLRREDGTADPLSKGVWVDPAGGKELLTASGVELLVLDEWTSPVDGTVYPSRWRITIPSQDLILEAVPIVPNQEMGLTFRYWEGAVRVEGIRSGKTVRGVGYVELTGYEARRGPLSDGRRIGRTAGGSP